MKGLCRGATIRLVFFTFFLLMSSNLGLATDDQPVFDMQMGDESLLFQDIPSIFGASKYEQKVTEAPSATSIVTADEIQKLGYKTLAEILQSVQGFYNTYDRNYHYAGVRGFSNPGDYNTRLLLLVDGHRLNDTVYDAAYIGTEFVLDVDLIERVEVIRGPSSSLYGASAFFGVVNVITKKGRSYRGGQISTEAVSYDTYKTRFTYGDRFTNDFEILVSGTYYDTQGQNHYFEEFDDPATYNGVADGIDGGSFGSIFLHGSFRDFTFQGGYVDRDKDVPTAPWGVIFNAPDTKTTDRRGYLNLKYETVVRDNWEVMAKLQYDHYEADESYAYDYAESGEPLDLALWLDGAHNSWWGTEIQVTKTFAEKHKVVFGGQYQDNPKQDQYSRDPYWVYLDDKRNSTSWALFLQDEYRITSNIILNAGLRHDNFDTFGESTNPRLALIVSPSEKTSIKLLYGTAFRAPSIYEFYYNDGGETTKSNPNLTPEEIATYEIVLERYVWDRFRLATSGYYYEIDDLITQTTDPQDELLVFVNQGKVEALGFEIEFEGKWESGLEFRLSYSYQDSENKETGQSLTNSPEHMTKFNLIAPLVREALFAGLEVQYTDDRKTLMDTTAKGFFLTNLTLTGNNLLENMSVSASIYNLFDKSYGYPGSGEHLQPTIQQDGRTYRIKITYSF